MVLDGTDTCPDPPQSCRFLWHEHLESRDFRCTREARFQQSPVYRVDILSAARRERLRYDCAGLRQDDDAAALARMAHAPSPGPLAPERPLLPTSSGDGRSPESRISHC